jgi:hypothetical protein
MRPMDDKYNTGRIVGTASAGVLVVSVLAIIFMAAHPNVPSRGDSSLHLLPPPTAEVQGR